MEGVYSCMVVWLYVFGEWFLQGICIVGFLVEILWRILGVV